MKTFTININEAPTIDAKDWNYTNISHTTPSKLYPLINNNIGLEPTEITSITPFVDGTIGTAVIDTTIIGRIIFTPNGVIDTDSFDYTITDSLSRTSTGTITITTT